jgi:hypothetical protein
MMYDFQISDANVGQTIGPQDGYLVSLVMQTPPSRYEVPDFNAAAQQYTSGYFVLRGSGDTQNIYCSLTGFVSPLLVRDHSLNYRGDPKVACVPKGSVWSVTLSDQPNPRAPLATPGWAPSYQFAGGLGYKHVPPGWKPPGDPPPPPPPPKVMHRPPPDPPQAFRPLWARTATSAAN